MTSSNSYKCKPGKMQVNLIVIAIVFQNLVLTAFSPTAFAEDSRFFPETKHTVSGKFLDYGVE